MAMRLKLDNLKQRKESYFVYFAITIDILMHWVLVVEGPHDHTSTGCGRLVSCLSV
jgi:hypothetical protein